MTQLRLIPYIDSAVALGVFLRNGKDEQYFGHGGQDRGFVGRYWGSLNGGIGVVVMANSDNDAIIDELINSVATVYNWKGFYTPFMMIKHLEVNDQLLTSYSGKYSVDAESDGQFQLKPGLVFAVTKSGHLLQTKLPGQGAITIYPMTNNIFFPKTSDTDITFIKDGSGRITSLSIHQNGKHIECKKID